VPPRLRTPMFGLGVAFLDLEVRASVGGCPR
jgi:hypothetical protein